MSLRALELSPQLSLSFLSDESRDYYSRPKEGSQEHPGGQLSLKTAGRTSQDDREYRAQDSPPKSNRQNRLATQIAISHTLAWEDNLCQL